MRCEYADMTQFRPFLSGLRSPDSGVEIERADFGTTWGFGVFGTQLAPGSNTTFERFILKTYLT